MNYYLVHNSVRLGRVNLERLEYPGLPERVKLPPWFAGELVTFSEYERIRLVVRAQNPIAPPDLAAPWNTAAEEAEIEAKYIKALDERPIMPYLELRDDDDRKVRVSSLEISELDCEGEAIIRLKVLFPDDDIPITAHR